MPTPCYLSLEGATQGNITADAFTADSVGNVYVEGHENEMLIQQVNHAITVPTDPQSGQPTGQRVHYPLTVVTALNKATPLILNAVTTGEKITKAELKWYRTSIEGKQEHFFTYILDDAVITSLEVGMPHAQDSSSSEYTQLVSINLTYRKITLEHDVAGTSGSDDWRKPIT